MAINPDELDKLMKEAGLGSRSQKKLREANEAKQPEEAPASRGHGAPSQVTRTAGRL